MQQFSELPTLIDVYKIPEKGKRVKITATLEQCQAIAKRLRIPAVSSLSAFVEVTNGSSIRVKGHFRAELKQTCVITLETIDTRVQGDFEEFFTLSSVPHHKNEVLDLDLEDKDPLPLEGHELDVGELVLEHLSLAMDPYPRKKGLPSDFFFKDDAFDSPQGENPFAKLADFKPKKTSS